MSFSIDSQALYGRTAYLETNPSFIFFTAGSLNFEKRIVMKMLMFSLYWIKEELITFLRKGMDAIR